MRSKILSFGLIFILCIGVVSAFSFSDITDYFKNLFGKKEVSLSAPDCGSNIINCGYSRTACQSDLSCTWKENLQACLPKDDPCATTTVHTGGSCNDWGWCQYSELGNQVDCFKCELKNFGPGIDVCMPSIGCIACNPTGTDNNCNGIDEDCDGFTDESYVSSSTSCGVGACANTGTKSCVNGVEVDSCTPLSPTTETCNNKNDDCDSNTDEDLFQSCYTGLLATKNIGLCHDGTQQCSAGIWGSCNNQQLPVAEVCNDNLDNDCDTKTDCADSNCAATGLVELGGSTCGVDNKCCSGNCELMKTIYADSDNDGFGDPDISIKVCPSTSTPFSYSGMDYVDSNNDCDDSNPNIYPSSSICYSGCKKCDATGTSVIDASCNPNSNGDCKKCDLTTGAIILDDEFPVNDGDCKKCDTSTNLPIADDGDIPTTMAFPQYLYFPLINSFDIYGRRDCLKCSGMVAVFDESRNPANDGDCKRCDAAGQYMAQDNEDTLISTNTCKKCQNGLVVNKPDGWTGCDGGGLNSMCCNGFCRTEASAAILNQHQCCGSQYISKNDPAHCGSCTKNCPSDFPNLPYCRQYLFGWSYNYKCVECRPTHHEDCPKFSCGQKCDSSGSCYMPSGFPVCPSLPHEIFKTITEDYIGTYTAAKNYIQDKPYNEGALCFTKTVVGVALPTAKSCAVGAACWAVGKTWKLFGPSIPGTPPQCHCDLCGGSP